MKLYKIGILFLTMALLSCNSKEKELISDYEQTLGNTKIDLNLKFNQLELVKEITSADSLEVLSKFFNKEKSNKIIKLNEYLKTSEKQIENYKRLVNLENDIDVKKIYQSGLEREKLYSEDLRNDIISLNSDCSGTSLEITFNKIEKFKKSPDSLLCKVYNVEYTIVNPMLNNAKQTISKAYYLSPDIDKVLKVNDSISF